VLKSFVISQAERVEENQYAPSAFFQRTAGWCKAVGEPDEIPPGAAFLKDE
jgi:hypothetical protein